MYSFACFPVTMVTGCFDNNKCKCVLAFVTRKRLLTWRGDVTIFIQIGKAWLVKNQYYCRLWRIKFK